MSNLGVYPGRAGIVQRILAPYRIPVFRELAERCQGGLSVAAGRSKGHEEEAGAGEGAGITLDVLVNLHVGRGACQVCWQSGLMRWLRSWDPAVLIVEANPRCIRTLVAARWMRRRRRKVLGWGMGTHPMSARLTMLRSPFRRWFVRRFDAVIAYGSRAASEYAATGVRSDRIYVAHNAVLPSVGASRPGTTTDPRPRPRVSFVGRITAAKRVDLLLRACAALPQHLQPDLTIVGEGEAREAMQRLAGALYPAGEFVGAKRGRELEPYWQASDLFALPGQGGLAVHEAMAHGLPVIVGEGDGTQVDLVRPGNGWTVRAGDLEALVRVLTEALSDLPALRQKGAESLRIVEQEINVSAMVTQMVRAMCEVTGVRPLVAAE